MGTAPRFNKRHGPASTAATSSGVRRIINDQKRNNKNSNCGSRRSQLHAYEPEIAFSTVAFSSLHIGMSAVRRNLIEWIGDSVKSWGWIGTGARLPDVWPGDESAGQEIFPDAETIVSFATLGYGFATYLSSLSEQHATTVATATATVVAPDGLVLFNSIAAISWGISIASLVNPSPLSLVPVYEQEAATSGMMGTTTAIRRKDSRKLQPVGLTRVTRHPLILPVVPWGIATALAMGGQPRDWCFFGVLSLYAIAGCAAQDLRVVKEEGSVGTVFCDDSKGLLASSPSPLKQFFNKTSFLPFAAIIESRQSLKDAVMEVPWVALFIGTAVGYQLQEAIVTTLSSYQATAA